jgi:hypothetical protein
MIEGMKEKISSTKIFTKNLDVKDYTVITLKRKRK